MPNSPDLETVDPEASGSINSIDPPIIYSGTNTEEAATFRTSTDYPRFQQQYEQAIDDVIQFVDQHDSNANRKTGIKNNFTALKARIFSQAITDDSRHMFYQAKGDMEKIANLLAEKKNQPENTLLLLLELSKDTAHCAEGAKTQITLMANTLSQPTLDLFAQMQNAKEQITQAVLSEYVRINKGRMDLLSEHRHPGFEIHIVNAYMNQFNQALDIPARNDNYANQVRINPASYEACQKALMTALTPWQVTTVLAEEGLNRLKEQIGNQAIDAEMLAKLTKNIQQIYGDIGLDAFFSYDENGTSVQQDPTQLQLAIANKLSARQLPIEPMPVDPWLDWSIQEVKEADANGNRVLRIGDLFWKEDKYKIISQPDVSDLQADYINQIAPAQLMRIIEQADDQHAAILGQIHPQRLQATSAEKIALFFSKLGADEGINYATRHFDWFTKLGSNPLLPLLLTLTDDKIDAINPDLLRKMPTTALSAFFRQRNNNPSAVYIERYTRLLKKNQDVAADNSDDSILSTIKLKQLVPKIIIKHILAKPDNGHMSHANKFGKLLIFSMDIDDQNMAKLLLQQPAIDLKQTEYGYRENPLYLALRKNQSELVPLLLEKHALKDYQDPGLYNLLYHPIKNKNAALLELLLKAGADPNRKSISDTSILSEAVLSGDPLLVTTLLRYQATDDQGQALQLATVNNNAAMVTALRGIAPANPIITNRFAAVISSDELRQNAAVPLKPVGRSYTGILASLDTLHRAAVTEQIAAAFTLKHQIYLYIKNQPTSGRRSAFEDLNKQIDDTLFAPDTRMEPIKQQIIDMAKKQPDLAADFYQKVLSKPQDDRQIFADFMQKGMDWDIYFTPVESVAETAINESKPSFDATFQVDLAAQFNDFKIILSQARIDGSETAKFFLDEANKRVYLGYSFKELINLDPNIVGLLRRAIQVEYATNNSFEETLLDKCVNKTYLRKEQKARLAQLETTYNAIYHTDIAAWEEKYAGQALTALNQQIEDFHQPDSIGDQLRILLGQKRKGLLINNTFERNIGRSPDSQRFIVDHMDSLKALGVTTIGLPLHQDLQPLIDAYLKPNGTMSNELQEETQHRSLTSLFVKAKAIDLKIVALNIDNDGTLYQIGMANNAIVEKLNNLPQGEKFVAICRKINLQSQPGTGGRFLPGVNRLMQLPTVKIGSNDNLTVLADDPPAQNFSPLGNDNLYPATPKPPTKENKPSQRSYFEKRFLSKVSDLFMSQYEPLDTLLRARIQMKQLRSHRGLVQGHALPEETFELHIGDNNRYSIKNRANANDVQIPDGTYLFVNRVDEPGTVRLIKLGAEIQSPFRVGHTSMTQNEGDQHYDPVDVYYAGEMVFKQGILEKWTNGSGHYQPDEAQAKTNILPVVQRLLPLEKFETGWARYYEMLGTPLPVSNESVYQWDKPAIKKETVDGDKPFLKKKAVIYKPNRFDSQIILQLENDPTVMAAAGALFNKHPNHSVLVQLDMQGDYRVIYGDAKALQGNVRWQLVGHGRDGINNQNNQTFGGRSATELPRQIKQLSAALGIDYGINSKPNYISLVGCSLIDPEKQTGYAPQLLSSLNEQGIRADLSVRRTWLTVNEQGQKLTRNTDGQWQRKISEDKLILSWNKQGELLPATDLTIRLSRAMTITDELALGKITLPSLDATSRRELADVFQLADGSLDERRLTLTTLDKTSYLAWRNDVNQLQQLSDIHPQLNSLSGQAALQQSKQWNERQAASIGAWQAVGIKSSQPEVEIQTRIAPQGLYIGNNSLNAGADAMAQGLAWLNARASGEAATHRFLSALVTYALINEQKASGVLSEQDATQIREFRQRFEALKQATSISDKTVFSAQTDSPFNSSDGNYLLKTAHHALMLSCRTEQGKAVYYLYDPNVGEMRFSGTDGLQNRNALQAALHHYLADKDNPTETQTRAQQYGIELKEERYQFDVYKVDISKAKTQLPALDNLQQLVGDFRSEAQRLATAADVQLGSIRLPARVLSEMGAHVGGKPLATTHLSQTNLVSSLRFDAEALSRYLITADSTDASAQKAVQLLKQQIMTVGKTNKRDLLITDGNTERVTTAVDLLGKINHHVTAGDSTQIKATLWPSLQQFTPASRWDRLNRFSHAGNNLMQAQGYIHSLYNLLTYAQTLARDDITASERKELLLQSYLATASFSFNIGTDISQYGFGKLAKHLANRPIPNSRLGQIGFKAGSKLARFGGPVLSAAGSGFDIYGAYQSFSALSSTTDPKARQDLIVSGSLSVVSAAVGIGTAIGFALGGTAAAIAGPLGLAAGGLLIAGGQVYSAVREVEEIQKYVKLSPEWKLRTGWLAFWGLEQDAVIHNRVAYRRTFDNVTSHYHQQLTEEANELLLAHSDIDTLYYSRGKVVLKKHLYKRLKGQELKPTTSAGNVGGTQWSANKILLDKIKPEDAGGIYYRHSQTKHNGITNQYQHLSLEDSDYEFYEPLKPEGINDNVNISSYSEHVIKQPQVTGHRERVGRFIDQEDNTLIKDLNVFQRDYHTVMGDFNGDGYKDIGYFSDTGFYLLSADGKGRYSQPQRIEGIQSLYYGITRDIKKPQRLVKDINNDGRDDIIVITELHGNSLLNISLAKEEGGFTTSPQSLSYKLPDLSEPPSVLADIDGDGCADLVSWDRYNIRVNYGGREGKFSTSAPIPLLPLHQIDEPHRYIHHIAGDINGDGRADLISFTPNGEFYTLLGSSSRQQPFTTLAKQKNKYAAAVFSFVDANTKRVSFNTEQLQLKDMNADGYADLVVIKQDGHYSIAYGDADGTFSLEQKGDWGSEEENGSLARYRPNILALYGQQQILGISIGTDGKNTLLSLNQAGEVNAHTFDATRFQDTVVMFRLWDGNDTAMGQPGRRNFFEVNEGTKNFTGERYADSFLLMGKAAPSVPSILNGGENASSTTPLDDNDTVSAAAKPADGDGYQIDLTTGYARYWNSGKVIAKLHNIEHAQGHSKTDDYLRGNEGNNQLNGMGGRDSLFGEGGDDFLTLQAGVAAGGTGKDNYHILQNNSDQDVSVLLRETQGTQEISNILLDYKAEQIISLTLENNDVLITLNNDNNTRTRLKLCELYPSPTGDNERKPQHNYILYTRDGLMIADWLPTLSQNAAGNWPFTPLLKAQYHPDWDRNWQQHTQGKKLADIVIHLQQKNKQSLGQISFNNSTNSTIVLPTFMQLIIADTPFNDRLEGDDKNNLLRSTQGKDILVGKGGSDHYVIDAGKTGREIIIDNYDAVSPLDNLAQDVLLLPLPVEQIRLQQKGDGIVLSHHDAPELHPKVRIRNFMKGERYRHLLLMDKNGRFHGLTVDPQGKAILLPDQVTQGDDRIVLYSSVLTNNSLNALAGDDIVIDKSGSNHTLYGGEGNDILLVEAGNNHLSGDAGNDTLYGGTGRDILLGGTGDDQLWGGNGNDTLLGGTGNDMLSGDAGDDRLSGDQGDDILMGGDGDDSYLFVRGDGIDLIKETGGQDRISFISNDISKKELGLMRKWNDLHILVKKEEQVDNHIIIQGHYADSKNRIETIQIGKESLTGNNIDLLAETMSGFLSQEGMPSLSHLAVQTQINRLWLTTPAA